MTQPLINSLCSETVEGSALSLESVDDIHGGDGLSLGVLGVGDGVSDDSLEEALQHVSGVVVDLERNSLHTSSSGQSSDGRLGDAFQQRSVGLSGVLLVSDLAGTFAETFSDSLSSLSNSGHYVSKSKREGHK